MSIKAQRRFQLKTTMARLTGLSSQTVITFKDAALSFYHRSIGQRNFENETNKPMRTAERITIESHFIGITHDERYFLIQ